MKMHVDDGEGKSFGKEEGRSETNRWSVLMKVCTFC